MAATAGAAAVPGNSHLNLQMLQVALEQQELQQQQQLYQQHDLHVHFAASLGDVAQLTSHLFQRPNLRNKRDHEGMTPIFYAVSNNHAKAVEALIDAGARVNVMSSAGFTPVHLAAQLGLADMVRVLLDNGAKSNVKDKLGRTVLHLSTECKEARALHFLLSKRRHKDLINTRDKEGMTALHWAAFRKRPNHTKALIAKGASEDLLDMDKKSALHWAAQSGSPMCCTLLLNSKSGPLLNSKDKDGNSCMHLAAAGGHCSVIKALGGRPGCDLEAVDKNLRTPLHWAAATGHAKAIEALLSLRVNPAAVDREGCVPYDYAITLPAHNQRCVALLAKALVDIGRDDLLVNSGVLAAQHQASAASTGSKVAKMDLLDVPAVSEHDGDDSASSDSGSASRKNNGGRFQRMRSVDTQGPSFPKSARIGGREIQSRRQQRRKEEQVLIAEQQQQEQPQRQSDADEVGSQLDDNAIVELSSPVSTTPNTSFLAGDFDVPATPEAVTPAQPRAQESRPDSSAIMARLLAEAQQRKQEELTARQQMEALEQARAQKVARSGAAATSEKPTFDYDRIEASAKAAKDQVESAQRLLALNGKIDLNESMPPLQRRSSQDGEGSGSQAATELLKAEVEAHAKSKQRLAEGLAEIEQLKLQNAELKESLRRTKKDNANKTSTIATLKKSKNTSVALRAQLLEEQKRNQGLQAQLRQEEAARQQLSEHVQDLEAKLRFWQSKADPTLVEAPHGSGRAHSPGRVKLPSINNPSRT